MASKIRETMNKLLHLRRSIIQYIDTEIEVVKKLLTGREFPPLEDCIYLIKEVNVL